MRESRLKDDGRVMVADEHRLRPRPAAAFAPARAGEPPRLELEQLRWGRAAQAPLGALAALRLVRGEALAVVGPNGAGKTSLMLTLCGALPALAGTLRLGGEALAALAPRARAQRVALLPQTLALDPELTVRELVELGRTPHLGWWGRLAPEDHAVVEGAIARCDLQVLSEQPLGRLSGGERQRALVAMTVAQQAPLLLLDEPTTHLDLRWRHQLFELLQGLRRDLGVAVVMVLHDLAEAYREADRVLVLGAGRAEELARDEPARCERLATVFGVPPDRLGV
ncbi:MAG: ABC transporter ATP-binding protein [Proteobacteria bacterium]|nr:ABC transporter ATP-binding protein [Pseudomonadota bacterium]